MVTRTAAYIILHSLHIGVLDPSYLFNKSIISLLYILSIECHPRWSTNLYCCSLGYKKITFHDVYFF